MCLFKINLPNLCPNMNHFDAVDFSECHSEEVISFFLPRGRGHFHILKVTGTCRWTGYDFCGHHYWHKV